MALEPGTSLPLDPALLRELAEASAAITFIYQGERNVYANAAAERATGYSREELAGLNFWDIIHPDSRGLVRERGLARQRGEPVPPNYEVKIITKQGEARWLDFTGVPFALGGEVAVLGTAFDITERIEAQQALRDAERQVRRLVDTAFVGVMRTNLRGEILFANQATLDLFGAPSLEALQAVGIPSRYKDPTVREVLMDRLRRDGKVERFDATLLKLDGREVQVETSITLEEDGLSGVLVDVTERRRLEEEALRGQRLESLGVLAGGVAHDFNNFLTVILTNVSLALHRAEGRGGLEVECLEDAKKACLRAKGLTQQLLTFARGGAPATKPLDLARLLQEAVGFGLRGSNVRCAWDLPDDLPWVEADEGQLGQVVHNLVLNAVQAMPTGGTLWTEARVVEAASEDPDALQPRYVSIRFRDEGPGIPEAEQSRVFDPYFTTKPTGRGLGLAAAHSIVSRHSGVLRLESTPGQGATFVVGLPIARASRGTPAVGGSDPIPRGSSRVLVMDDEAGIRKTVERILEELGYGVEVAEDGTAALQRFQAARDRGEPFDLVVLDLTVPGGVGGEETLRRLREVDPEVRAVVSSGYATSPILSRYREAGFVGRLLKPFTLAALAKCVAEALSESPERS